MKIVIFLSNYIKIYFLYKIRTNMALCRFDKFKSSVYSSTIYIIFKFGLNHGFKCCTGDHTEFLSGTE